ncbi:hypothetical protein [Kitasatospora sp. NPDC018614]
MTTEAERTSNLSLLKSFEDRTDGADSTMAETVAEIGTARTERLR